MQIYRIHSFPILVVDVQVGIINVSYLPIHNINQFIINGYFPHNNYIFRQIADKMLIQFINPREGTI